FYLVAAFVSAWYGGYAPGALCCLLILVGLPLAAEHSHGMPPVDFSRIGLLLAISLLISRTADTQRRAQAVLKLSNDELDKRVQSRTEELSQAVVALQSEVERRNI